jgi:hypothetical protein
MTTHNTHMRQTSMLSAEFKPKISASKLPQTYALDRVATGTGSHKHINNINCRLAQIYFYFIYSGNIPRLQQSSADKSQEICELHMHRLVWISVTLGFHVYSKSVRINRRAEGKRLEHQARNFIKLYLYIII